MTAEGAGTVMVRLHDVAPDGAAVMINQQVSALRPGGTDLQLRSTDWTLPTGHSLAVDIGTVQPGIPVTNDWLPTVSGEQVTVQAARLDLALDDPVRDVRVPGTPAPWIEIYRQSHTSTPTLGRPTFTL